MTPQPPILTKILSVEKHPNADTLDITKVLGFQVVVKQGQYKVGDEALYFEPETAFSFKLAAELNILNYLSEKTDSYGQKVCVIKEVKLRGVLSEGLLLPTYFLEVYDFKDCFKYEAPPKSTRNEDAAPEVAEFPQYDSLINLRKEPRIFAAGQGVVVTEKIHGTNSRVGFFAEDGKMTLQAGSRTINRKAPANGQRSLYWEPYKLMPFLDFFTQLHKDGVESAVVYGEIYGPTVQNYSYGLVNKEIGYRAFTVKINGTILDPLVAIELLQQYNIETAPVIYQGPYSYDLIRELAETPTLCAPKEFSQHLAEGVVVQSGTIIAKYVSTDYLLSKAGKNKLADA